MYRKILIIVLGQVLFSACSEASEEIGENDPVENNLAESGWVLTSLNGEPLL